MRRLYLFCTSLALFFLLSGASLAQTPDDEANKTKGSSPTSSPAKAPMPAPAKRKSVLGTPSSSPRPAPSSNQLSSSAPRSDLFFGYSFVRVNPSGQANSFNMNGGSFSLAYNFTRYFGFVGDFGGYHAGNVAGTGKPGNIYNYLFGPRFDFRQHPRFTPFLQALIGGVRGTGPSPLGTISKSALAGVAGAGLDLNVNDRFSIRLVQGDYFYTRFRNIPGTSFNQNNLRISTGVVLHIGKIEAPPPPVHHPPVASCSADKSSIVAESGEAVAVRAQASSPDNLPLSYAWSATGGRVDGTGSEVRWNSAGVSAGTYTVNVRVEDGQGGTASCGVDVRVEPKPHRPPVMSCSVDRTTVLVGEKVKVTAQASSPEGEALAYTWRTNGGQIVGTGATVELDTSGLSPGHYMITGRVEDQHGAGADCSTGVEVQAPPPAPQASKINECQFNRMDIARVDNACKRILDDVALRMKNEPRGTVVLIGYADPKERKAAALAEKRASNVKEYLTAQGIDGSRITVRGASGQAGGEKENRRVEIIWVPEGATY